MHKTVLKYCHEDFDILIQTNEIDTAWNRFQGRINYRNEGSEEKSNPFSYCAYEASKGFDDVLLYSYQEDKLVSIELSKHYWPVVYETNKYHIVFQFKIDPGTPNVRHIRRDIEDAFFYNMRQFTGDISFLNEPGLFRLGIEYQKEGRSHEEWITFQVVSPKLDVKHDYNSILKAVNAEFEGLIFRYCSLTMQQLVKGKKCPPLEAWMQVFEDVVHDYLKNVDRIIKNPHSKVRTQILHAHADRIKRWTPAMEEEYKEKETADYDKINGKTGGQLEKHYFRYSVYDKTVNSLENRFVKYTLQQIGKQLEKVFANVLTRQHTDISQSYFERWEKFQQTIHKYLKHPFFDAVGKFEGMRQESMVLQGRMGYQQIYKDWLKLRKGIDFYQGTTNIGTLQIWEIYELWCFIKVKNMVLKVLQLDPQSPLITEPNGSLVNYQRSLSANNRADYRIVIQYPSVDQTKVKDKADAIFAEQLEKHKGDVISIHYQHMFSRVHEDDFDIRSMTTEQRPDIIVNIKKANGEVLTYLYDAKYRVWSDTKLDKTEDWYDTTDDKGFELKGADYPPADAINQMHRYRDSIYYGMGETERPRSKEVIGGYVLFPGRGDDESIANRFYSKSIQKVNIGAFPLLPVGKEEENTDPEGPQLYAHLKEILLEKETMYHHIEDSIPQRGLAYRMPPEEGQSPVLVGYVKSEQWESVIREKLYYTRIGDEKGSLRITADFEGAKYILLHDHTGTRRELYLLGSKGPRIFTKGQLEEKGFKPKHGEVFLVFDIENTDVPTEIRTKLKNLKLRPEPYYITFEKLFES